MKKVLFWVISAAVIAFVLLNLLGRHVAKTAPQAPSDTQVKVYQDEIKSVPPTVCKDAQGKVFDCKG